MKGISVTIVNVKSFPMILSPKISLSVLNFQNILLVKTFEVYNDSKLLSMFFILSSKIILSLFIISPKMKMPLS